MSVTDTKVIEKLMIQGQSALRQGKNTEAHERFSEVVALDPENRDVFPFRAEALRRMGKNDEAEQDLDKQESPAATVERLLSQAKEFVDQESFDHAERSIIQANAHDATPRQRADAALMLGVLYAVTERPEEATKQYYDAQAFMPIEDPYIAKIIGLNTLIRVSELIHDTGAIEEHEKSKVQVAQDFVDLHEDFIPNFTNGHNLRASIAVSISGGELKTAQKKLWQSISTNMDYANSNLSHSALSNTTCLVTSGTSVVDSNLFTELAYPVVQETRFAERSLEKKSSEQQSGVVSR